MTRPSEPRGPRESEACSTDEVGGGWSVSLGDVTAWPAFPAGADPSVTSSAPSTSTKTRGRGRQKA